MRSSYLLDSLIDKMLTLGPFSLSLHSADPGESGDNEVTRQSALLLPSAIGEVVNDDVVEFGPLPDSTITHMGVWGGERFLMGLPLPSQKVESGQYLRWSPNSIVIRFD